MVTRKKIGNIFYTLAQNGPHGYWHASVHGEKKVVKSHEKGFNFATEDEAIEWIASRAALADKDKPMPTRKKTSRSSKTTKSPKSRKSARVLTGWANKSTIVPGLRYLVQGVDRVGKSRTQRAHSVSAARTSRAAKSLVSGSIIDTVRNVVMVTISSGRSKRTGAAKPWNRANLR